MTTAFGRASLGVFYLLSANLVAGYLALELDYPSLWGDETGVFFEYALPLPFYWGLAHWLSLLPLTLLVLGMPLWRRETLRRAQWIFAAIILLCVIVELKLPFGTLRKTPFVLFFFVDFVLVLLVSLSLTASRRVIITSSIAVLVVAVTLWQLPTLKKIVYPGALMTVVDKGVFEDIEEIRLTVELRPDATEDEVCRAARQLHDEELASSPGYRVTVLFWSRVEPRSSTYPAGRGELNEGAWRCEFVPPGTRSG